MSLRAKQTREKNRLIMNNKNNERLTFPAGISLGRNFTATKDYVRSSGGFSSHFRQSARDAQKDAVFTKRCIPAGMRKSK
jgi:hypothetical protein